MASASDLRAWYVAGDAVQHGIVQHAFTDAVRMFSTELSKDELKSRWIEDAQINNIESLLHVLGDAQKHYTERKGESKVRDALDGLAEKAHHYSSIMDVFVAHHPEYTALVWGAMKFLFVGVTNQQKLICKLAEGLTEIATLLPRARLLMHLYPTQQIYQTVVSIYAYIIRFLLRALGWYKETKIQHAIHAITRPAELRYNDILAKIALLSQHLTETAWAGSHAEQRDMHIAIQQQLMSQQSLQEKVDHLANKVLEMQVSITAERSLNDCARIEFRQKLSEIQLIQFLDQIYVRQVPEPAEMLLISLWLAQKRLLKPSQRGPPFWMDHKMQLWNQCQQSSFIMISGTWATRHYLQNFCPLSIRALQDSHVPALWVLNSIAPAQSTAVKATTVDLIKYLVVQAVKLNERIHTDAALVPCLKSYLSARTEEDWTKILSSVLEGIPILYMLIDLQVLGQSALNDDDISAWPRICAKVIALLQERNAKTVLRIALVTYGSQTQSETSMIGMRDQMVLVGKAHQRRVPRGRLPHGSLRLSQTSSDKSLDLSRLSQDIPQRVRRGRAFRSR